MPVGAATEIVPAVTSGGGVCNGDQSGLQAAVTAGDAPALARLLEGCRGSSVNVNQYDSEGQTALHRGSQEGHVEVVKLLVKYGADIRLANRDGWNALHLAAYAGHQEITRLLVETAFNNR